MIIKKNKKKKKTHLIYLCTNVKPKTRPTQPAHIFVLSPCIYTAS